MRMLAISLIALTACASVPTKQPLSTTTITGQQVKPKPSSTTSERRMAFKALLAKAAESTAIETNCPTKVESVYFSTRNELSTETDGAIVVLLVGSQRMGLVFFYKDKEWQVVPDDFQ